LIFLPIEIKLYHSPTLAAIYVTMISQTHCNKVCSYAMLLTINITDTTIVHHTQRLTETFNSHSAKLSTLYIVTT